MLPPETLELVFGHLSQGDLFPVLLASSAFHRVAARVLYRVLIDVPPKRSLRLVQTLARNDAYPPLVRRFELEWTENTLTANFLRLLHRALVRLAHLSYLGLEFSATDNTLSLSWILCGSPFSLRVFTTSMRCDPALARFLATQHDLVEICLRGFSPAHRSADADADTVAFPLPPAALPRLRHFRTVLAAPCLTAAFLRGRPVESVSLALSPPDLPAALDALLLPARPLRRLTIMSFDAGTPAELVGAIARRLPALEALHAVALLRPSTPALLLDAAPALAHFSALRYLTFMAPGAEQEHQSVAEAEIAAAWGRACPSLKTIILPRGNVWGCVEGRWVPLHGAA